MEQKNKQQQIDVAQLKRLLLQQKISQPRFSLPLTREQAYDLLWTAAGNEVAFRGNTFVESKEQDAIMWQAADWCTQKRKIGIMLCGVPGNGKTTVMRAITRTFNIFDFKDEHGAATAFRWFSAMEIANLAKTSYKEYKKLCETPMLAIDDFGQEPAEIMEYGNIMSPVTDMLYIRYDRQLMTALTTNTPAKEIRERYGDRIADRFNEMMQVIIFTNPSYRGQN